MADQAETTAKSVLSPFASGNGYDSWKRLLKVGNTGQPKLQRTILRSPHKASSKSNNGEVRITFNLNTTTHPIQNDALTQRSGHHFNNHHERQQSSRDSVKDSGRTTNRIFFHTASNQQASPQTTNREPVTNSNNYSLTASNLAASWQLCKSSGELRAHPHFQLQQSHSTLLHSQEAAQSKLGAQHHQVKRIQSHHPVVIQPPLPEISAMVPPPGSRNHHGNRLSSPGAAGGGEVSALLSNTRGLVILSDTIHARTRKRIQRYTSARKRGVHPSFAAATAAAEGSEGTQESSVVSSRFNDTLHMIVGPEVRKPARATCPEQMEKFQRIVGWLADCRAAMSAAQDGHGEVQVVADGTEV